MPVNIVITTNGVNEVAAKLEGTITKSSDLTAPMKMGAQLMMGSINENFQASGRPMHWKSLAVSTLRQKIRKGYSSMPLIRSGMLKASITPKVDTKGFRVGTAVSYAKYNQFGTRHIPSRRFVIFQDQDIQDINKIVVDYIKGK